MMAQLVKCLSDEHKDLSSNPQHPCKRLSMVLQSYAFNMVDEDASDVRLPGTCWLLNMTIWQAPVSSREPVPKDNVESS